MYKSIITNPPAQSHSHLLKKYGRVVQITRVETTYGSTSPPLFVILVTLSSTFPNIFQGYTLVSTHPSYFHKLLKNLMDHLHRKQNFRLSIQAVIFPSRNLPQNCLIANRPTMLYLYIRIQCRIVTAQTWMGKCSHRALKFSRNN